MKRTLQLLFCLISTITSFGQTPTIPKDSTKNTPNQSTSNAVLDINKLIPQISPKSPNATAMERFGTYPVSLFSGLPSIEIPILDIKVEGLNIPIKLAYHASGNKVTDVATFVGLGWSLVSGGAVTRQVKGVADEINVGLLGKQIPVNVQTALNAPCFNEDVRFAYEQMATNNIDTERDLFAVNMPSKSNQFILKDINDYQWLMPEASKVQFTRSTNSNNSNSFFEIRDEASNYYLFDEPEITTNVGITTWLLKKIQGKKATDKVIFEYYPETSFSRTHDIFETVTINDNPNGIVPSGILTPSSGVPTPSLVSINNSVEERLPKTIYFPLGKIEFVLEANERLDGLGKALDKIEIYSYKVSTNSYALIKSYDLVYTYKNRADNSPVLFLSEVKLIDNVNVELGKYSLAYDTTVLPGVQSKSKDYWGYCNGIANTSLIATQSIPLYLGGTSTPTTLTIGSGNRNSQESYMKAWVLNKITYPTGGYTDFDFEANQYLDGTTPKKVGGLRIRKIASYASSTTQPIIKYYRYGQNESGNGHLRTNLSLQYESKQKILHYQVGNPPALEYSYDTRHYSSNLTGALFPYEGSPVSYAYVTEYDDEGTNSNGKTVYEFREEDDGKVTLVNSAKFFIQSKHWNRGQLSRKRVYGQDNKIKFEEQHTYQTMGVGSTTELCGRLIQAQNVYDNARPTYLIGNNVCYSTTNDFDPNQVYYFEYGTSRLIRSETYTYEDTDETKYVYTKTESDFDNNYFQVKETRSYLSNGSINLQRFRYVTDLSNLNSGHSGNALALYQMKANNDISTPIEVLSLRRNISDAEAKVLGGQLVNFQINAFNSYNFIVADNIHLLEISPLSNVFESAFTVANVSSGGSIVKDNHYAMRLDFGTYNTYGNLLDYQIVGSPSTGFTYSTTLLNGVYHSFPLSSSQNLGGASVQTTSFAYELPLLGIKQLTAPNGLNTYFDYDTFGRLERTKDHDDNKIVEYNYSYGILNRTTTIQYRVDKNGFPFLPNNVSSAYAPINLITHEYFDGLGRPTQKVAERRSPMVKDIVLNTILYDGFGRVAGEVAAFPSTESDGSSVSNAVSLAQSFYTDNTPYTTNHYKKTPLNQFATKFGLGNAWVQANKKWVYFDEVANNGVKYYTADAAGNILLNGSYPINSLFKKKVLDEQGNTSIDIVDNEGKLLQRQVLIGSDSLTTYTIYDDFGRVSAILQPEAYALKSSITQGSDAWKNGVFFYKYDARGRVYEKHVPNGGSTYIVYDKLNREVLSQDAHQQTLNKWTFNKYDELSRVVLSGEILNNNSRTLLQSLFDAQSTISETFDSTLQEQLYYTDVSFPFAIDSSQAMEVNFYDNYAAWRDVFHGSFSSNPYSNAKGLLTGVKKRYTETGAWLTQAMYYDKRNRMIYTRKDYFNVINPLPESRDYFFDGELFRSDKFFGTSTILRIYLYDFAGRTEELLINLGNSGRADFKYAYNEIEQLITKKIQPNRQYQVANVGQNYINRPPAISEANTQDIANKAVIISAGFVADSTNQTYIAEIDTTHSNGLVDAMQTVNYSYHLRGQLNCINCRNKQVRPDPKENDFFSMKLGFEEDKRYFDGNISYQTWKTPFIAKNQQYKYLYDGVNRLTKSLYSGGASGNYSLDSMVYDRNGNILQLKRHTIDNLSYNYNGNQLLSVSDGGTVDGFKDGNTTGNDYGYWANGSLKFDKNKGIDSILYHSYLKKVNRVKFANGNWVNFYYDGAGTLLKRKLSNGDEWVYQDEIILKNNKYYQINHEEGRAVYDTLEQKWVHEFGYRDHQGNLRLSFRDSLAAPVNGIYAPPVITQITEQDPWGFEIKPLSYSNGINSNNYKFLNRQDLPELDGVSDLVNRFYDKQIGRFWATDSKVDEGQHSFTPFHYSFNNPIRFSDPDGLMACCGDDPDGLGNGMTLVENIYWSTRDALVSSIATVSTFIGSKFSDDVKTQRVNATYSSGSRTLTAETVPQGEVVKEVGGSVLILGTAVPSGGSNAGAGMLMARTGTRTSTGSSVIRTVKEQAEELVSANGGKNRVTLRSEKAQTDVDLRGEPHFDKKTNTTYDTPHTKTSPRNTQAPANQGARYNTTEKHANYNNTTQKEIRIVRKYLEKQ